MKKVKNIVLLVVVFVVVLVASCSTFHLTAESLDVSSEMLIQV